MTQPIGMPWAAPAFPPPPHHWPGGRLVVVGLGMLPPAVDVPQAIFALHELAVLGSFGSHAPDLDVVTFEGGGVRPHEVRTYADLWMNGNRIAAGLIATGLNKGDRFGLMMRNHPEFIETMVAASLTGGMPAALWRAFEEHFNVKILEACAAVEGGPGDQSDRRRSHRQFRQATSDARDEDRRRAGQRVPAGRHRR